ncbi:MAG: hypothetical protein AAGG44_16610, partial [Planctomycetota bacterium]
MKRRLATWSAILVCICVVLWPFVAGAGWFSPAHWHLAAAANSLEFDDGRFDEHLAKARLANADLESLYDYWLLRVQACLTEPGGADEIPQVIRAAKVSGVAPRLLDTLASNAATRLQLDSKYLLAAHVLDFVSAERKPTPLFRNLITEESPLN